LKEAKTVAFSSSLIAIGDCPEPLINIAWAPYPPPPAMASGVVVFGGDRLLTASESKQAIPGMPRSINTTTSSNALFFLELSSSEENGVCCWAKVNSGSGGSQHPAPRKGAGLVGLCGGLWLWGG
jgi:hypothetical protein